MQPPGLKAMPIFSSPLLLHKVRIDEKGVDPVESNDGQGSEGLHEASWGRDLR